MLQQMVLGTSSQQDFSYHQHFYDPWLGHTQADWKTRWVGLFLPFQSMTGLPMMETFVEISMQDLLYHQHPCDP